MATTVQMFVGCDPVVSGAVMYFCDPLSRGWKPSVPTPTTCKGWLQYARNCRKISLPREVRRAGLTWGDATVRPDGWSAGCGHAPTGIHLSWSF
jgi:hypothetical protein